MSEIFTSTPHNEAKVGEIANTVIMPGDPLRARYIAEKYLEHAVQYNNVRGMLGYTGTYKGIPVSVQGHGMGCPSVGIYSYELYQYYDVQQIIRIGSAGAISDELKLGDIVLGMSISTDSNYGSQYALPGIFSPNADFNLLEKAVASAKVNELTYKVGNLLTSDYFYCDDLNFLEKWKKMGVLAVEMEAYALYCNAARTGRKALCITTISDCPMKNLKLTSEERLYGFDKMIKLSLDMIS